MFLDSSFIIALINHDDIFYEKARYPFEDLYNYDEIWLTDAILLELGDGLSKNRRDVVANFIKTLKQVQYGFNKEHDRLPQLNLI